MKENRGNCSLLECQICQQEMSFGRIKSHIKARHKEITVDQYIKQYWSTLPLHKPCEICNNNIVYKYKTCSKECHSTLISDQLKDKSKPEGFMSPQHRDKISKGNLGRIGGFTGYTHSEQTKKIQLETIKKTKPHLGHKQSDHQKQKSREGMLNYYSQGNEPWTKNNPHTPETIEKIFKHRKINKLEKFVSYILDQNYIEYTNQFFIKTKEGICKSYDFKIKNSNIILEIDGDYWHGGPSLNKHFYKLDEVKKNDLIKDQLAKDNNFILLRFWESDIYNQPDIIINKIKELM
jgi:very-short-patch-repair endonuclease